MTGLLRNILCVAAVAATSLQAANTWKLIGWSDFGVNPMERDYSVFAIYPPYGTLHAQLIDTTGALYRGTSNITVTYEAMADPNGSINSTSAGKTNFPTTWTAAAPQAMTFDGIYQRFSAIGIQITPYDDSLNINYYPVFKLTARDATGAVLATTRITLPVSNEVECRTCHASGANPDAKPVAGYANDSNPNRDFKLNILQLHDEKNRRNPTYVSALATLNYASGGLLATVNGGTAVSCTGCHASNEFGNAGLSGIESLTGAMHTNHASNIDPATGDTLDNGITRATCYNCHPGTHTQALRGPMSRAVATDGSLQIHCQNCHGTMSAIGDPARNGWRDLPNCQACHIGTAVTAPGGSFRMTTALDATGALRKPTDTTFATTANQPAAGFSLFRFSTGHGSLQCSACHGTAHAELASSQPNDNLQAIDLTGSAGPIQDCVVCHQSTIPSTHGGVTTGGPHGMHEVGTSWVNSHTRSVSRTAVECQGCHGTDLKGTALSQAFATRTVSVSRTLTIQMFRGYQVGCYTCHNGPGGNGNPPATSVVGNATANAISGQAATIPVSVTNAGLLRIVSQPLGGTAHVSGNSIVYVPRTNFEGTDTITYAAVNSGGGDSNLGTATVKVGAAARPSFTASGVTNAASYAPGIAPGMIAYVSGFGMGPGSLAGYELNSGGFIEKMAAGTRVLFNGVPAPVVYTSDDQLSAIVPYAVSGSTVNVVVEYNGIQSTGVPVTVSAALPGLFTANASGKGQGAVLNQDGSFNSASNPAARGSVVTLWGTGAGSTSPQVTVVIGGQAAQVQYAGEAAGLMQVNAVVPPGIAAGTSPVTISVNGVPSANGVTVEVK